MNLLLDTQVLLWILYKRALLSPAALTLLADHNNKLFFSSISVWEVAVKQRLERTDSPARADAVLSRLVGLQYSEVSFTSEHALATRSLPMIHKDPFDRALMAQALSTGFTLVTADRVLARYAVPVLLIQAVSR